MTDIAKIYLLIEDNRATKSLYELESYITSLGYDEKDVKHAINYVKNKEGDELFLLQEEVSPYNLFIKKIGIIFCALLSLLMLLGCIYFSIKFIKVLTTPDVIERDGTIIFFNTFTKGKLTVYLFLFAFFSFFGSLGFVSVTKKQIKNRKESLMLYEKVKNRK